jgi:hypothetical protein
MDFFPSAERGGGVETFGRLDYSTSRRAAPGCTEGWYTHYPGRVQLHGNLHLSVAFLGLPDPDP